MSMEAPWISNGVVVEILRILCIEILCSFCIGILWSLSMEMHESLWISMDLH